MGTNSTRLLIASVDEEQKIKVLFTGLKTTRLGEGINEGCLQPAAMERTLEAVKQFVSTAVEYGVQNVKAAATSAVRDAGNKETFLELVKEHTGIKIEILPGEAEAELSYQGVLAGIEGSKEGVMVVDVGGGSTEFSWFEAGRVQYASVNAGAVRMTEGGHSDYEILELLKPVLAKVDKHINSQLVAVGGTATTIAAMVQELETYDPRKVHGFKVKRQNVDELLQKLEAATLEERRKMPGLQPERADIIPAGVKIIQLVLKNLGFDYFLVSEADILWGLALRAAGDVERKYGITY